MNIDWTDKRAIGLKCWFSEPPKPEEYRDNFIGMVQGGRFLAFMNTAFSNCRIAQGEKTPYDGKGEQPIPDGIVIDVWGVVNPPNIGGMDFHGERVMSHEISWLDVTDYQVQEMPEEKNQLQFMDETVAEGKDKAVPIKQSTIDEIVGCLNDSRLNYADISKFIEAADEDPVEAICEIDRIDKLIKELKDLK